jgi:hypothetical protein
MRISTAFPSKYLRAADVDEAGGELTYTTSKVVLEKIGQDRTTKPVIYFTTTRLGLVLNKTNAVRLSASLGDETDSWAGRQIALDPSLTPRFE